MEGCRGEERGGERGDGGMADPSFAREKGDVGAEKEREKEEGKKLASFFGAVYEFFNPVPIPVAPVPVIPVVPVGHFISCYRSCIAFVITVTC